MADKKISQLTAATHVDGVDLGVVVQSGQTLKFDYDKLVALIQSSISVGSEFTFGTAIPQNTDGNDGDVYFKTDTLAFYRKVAGTWSVVFTFPTIGDGTLLYGTSVPSPTLAGSKNGDSYINTSTGIFYKKASGTWTQVFSMASGPQGPQGTNGTNGTNGVDGKTILNGTTNPSNLIGTDGDFYINSATLTMFGPKTAGVWGTGLTLVGPKGDTGLGLIQIMVSFITVTTKTINWQTDIPPGFTDTYASIFGNMYPKPYVYDDTDTKLDFSLKANRATPGDITTNLTTLVFDFGTDTTGTIQF